MIYWYILKFNFYRFIHYPFEILAATLNKALVVGFIVLFWRIVLAELNDPSRLKELATYFLIAEGISGITMIYQQKFGSLLRQSIRSGSISNYLIKPYKVLPAMYAGVWGERSINVIPSLLLIVVGLILTPPSSLIGFILFLYFLLISLSLVYSINLLEGVMTFYVTEPGAIMNSIAHLTRVLSGSYIPLSYFPVRLREVVTFLPFSMMIFTPITILQTERFDKEVLILIIVGMLWSVIFNVVIYYFWRRGIKQYEAIGL